MGPQGQGFGGMQGRADRALWSPADPPAPPCSQFVDLSCNELTEILIPEALPAALQELDLTGNTNLVLEHKTLDIFR